jgi:hypothetical protein
MHSLGWAKIDTLFTSHGYVPKRCGPSGCQVPVPLALHHAKIKPPGDQDKETAHTRTTCKSQPKDFKLFMVKIHLERQPRGDFERFF